jgi:hypothetical protein
MMHQIETCKFLIQQTSETESKDAYQMYCDFSDSNSRINELIAYRTPASHAWEIAIQGSAQGNCAFTTENVFELFGDVDF